MISFDHGAKYDPIVAGELDRGGAINTIVPGAITSKNATGMATSGFLVEVERGQPGRIEKEISRGFQQAVPRGCWARRKIFFLGG